MAANLNRRHTQINYGSNKASSASIEDPQHGQKRALTGSDLHSDQPAKIARPDTGGQDAKPSALSYKSSSPWSCLERQFTQNGMTICRGKMYAQQQVAVKRQKRPVQDLDRVIPHSHEHLVRVFDVFYEDETVYLVYEYMDVSLRNIASLPQRPTAQQIAMFCKAICSGLSYIHNTLRISLGNLDGRKVLVSRAGNIKIANIGDALLEDRSVEDTRADIRSIGLIMVELMEHTTSAKFPNELKIRNPEIWGKDSNILAFLADTQTNQLEQLLAHDFIPKTPDFSLLSSLVIITQMNAYIKTECIVPEATAI